MKLTIKQKLYGGYGLIIGLMLILTVTGISQVNFIDRTLATITDVNSVKQRYAINYRGSVHDRAIAVRDVVLLHEKQKVQEQIELIYELQRFYKDSQEKMEAMFAKGENITPKDRKLLSRINEAQEQTVPLIEDIIQAKQADNREKAREVLLQASPKFTHWLNVINDFIDLQENKNQTLTPEARETAGNFETLMITLLVIAVLFAASIAYFISKKLMDSLGAEPDSAADAVNNVSTGYLNFSLPNASAGSIIHAVSVMRDKLKEIASSIHNASSALSQKTDTVLQSSNSSNKSAKKQEELTVKLASDIEKISGDITSIADIAQNSEENAKESAQKALDGQSAASGTASKMEELTQKAHDSSSQVSQLDQHVQEISSATELIKEITDQTNLLALNAAIEAARAGEAGRGFAVVAEEIRKLAEKTNKTTEEITHVVSVVQQETDTTVDSIESIAKEIEDSFDQAVQTQKLLSEIHEQTESSLSLAQQTAQASSSQSQSVKRLSSDIEVIEKASKDTATQMNSNAKTLQELQQIIADMQKLIGFFKI